MKMTMMTKINKRKRNFENSIKKNKQINKRKRVVKLLKRAAPPVGQIMFLCVQSRFRLFVVRVLTTGHG